ncbi:MAG: hypothetical protein IPN79_12495 [Saprospiraceae bacterium]|nr:hypothetical protein [Saprospiraceae bacterium]
MNVQNKNQVFGIEAEIYKDEQEDDLMDLLRGVVVVIDEKVNEPASSGDLISIIIEKLYESNYPILKFTEIPGEKIINNLKNIAFIILDWNLFDNNFANIGAELKFSLMQENIEFIKKINSISFSPIFIFSAESINDIITDLGENGIYKKESPNNILVKSKADLVDSSGNKNELFKEIIDWLKQTQSAYVLKQWEAQIDRRKVELSWDLYNITPEWPSLLWKTYMADGLNEADELGILLTKILLSRTTPYEFKSELLNKAFDIKDKKSEIEKIFEEANFTKNMYLDPTSGYTGDVYKIDDKYFLNIKPNCDCIARGGFTNDDIVMYVLGGKEGKLSFDRSGSVNSKETDFRIYPINGGKSVIFEFNDFQQIVYKDLKEYRIGRIVSPQIIKAQQKFSNYLQRTGLMRMPEELREM